MLDILKTAALTLACYVVVFGFPALIVWAIAQTYAGH